jgi:hypothetical protein
VQALAGPADRGPTVAPAEAEQIPITTSPIIDAASFLLRPGADGRISPRVGAASGTSMRFTTIRPPGSKLVADRDVVVGSSCSNPLC